MTAIRHHMPFGAELTDDGCVRFRLWAPSAERVALELDGRAASEHLLDMAAVGNGWFERDTDLAGPGSRYRLRITGPRVEDGQAVPDPASRFQPDGVHAASEVIDPGAYAWSDAERRWQGRRWETAVLYELHTGTFSPEGTFAGAARRLPFLAELGVTAVELMPVAAFPGGRGWGYDGVCQYAPHAGYGRPEDLKAFVEQAHALGLMVFLDVVYNHFGPEGNYLHLYAPDFFTERHHTPWGAGLNFDGEHSRPVRDFFIHNALYWLTEYRFDGLRLDAVHAIADDSTPDILTELAEAVAAGPGRHRRVHLVLENDANTADYLARQNTAPRWYAAQWNDDFHHAAHVLLAGQTDGYYADYAEQHAAPPVYWLARCLAEGFGYQGERSVFRDNAPRGAPSGHLPPTAFVNFLQNHDQVGNRAFGERLHQLTSARALRAATAVLLLAPSPPLLFMGQPRCADSPFLFFCDFGEDLADAVTQGRRREFARFEQFADESARAAIPDPNDPDTFARSRLDWTRLNEPRHREWLDLHRHLLALRHAKLVPRLAGMDSHAGGFELIGRTGCVVRWRLGDDSLLMLIANLGDAELALSESQGAPAGQLLHLEPADTAQALAAGRLPPWTAAWYLASAADTPTASAPAN